MTLVKTWPLSRVLLACFAWVLVVSALLIWELVRAAAPVLVASEQSGAGALSISIAGLVIRAALLIVPPVVLYVVWTASRPK
jgi:hypothetical protein